jgi:hypothetical protein|tara:strand:+ start:310 stop:540 length:231 start_codon:yes stop_codon:yes gene_type:complete
MDQITVGNVRHVKPAKVVSHKELDLICNMTIELTKIKVKEVPHVSVQNFAADCFSCLLAELTMFKNGQLRKHYINR